MNNISQKNAIFGFKESNLLPYGKSDIKFVNNQSINQINVNNALQQLRDNDLYIENQLNYLSGYEPGPIAYSSDISSTFVDGQKYWIGTDPTQQLSILQKKNKIPQNTLSKNGSITGDVKYIVKYSGLYFCGATNNNNGKIYYSTNSKTWNELSGGDSYTYHKGDDKLLVGCGTNILFVEVSGSSPSAYQVNASGAFGSSPTAINVDDENRIYVGIKNKEIFTSKYDQLSDLTQSNLRFTKLSVDNTLSGWANDIVFREKTDTFTDENYIMASFKNGVAESFYQKHLSGEQRLFAGSQLCDMVSFNNKIYVGGTDGLSSITPITQKNSKSIYALDTCGDKLYYLTKDNGSNKIQVYSLSLDQSGDGTRVVNTNLTCDATDLVVVQSDNDNSLLYFIATTRGIYYCYSKEQTIKRLNALNTSELAANKIGNDLYLYASEVKNNNTKCFSVYKVTGHNNNLIVESDSTEIQSLQQRYSAINNIHSGLLRYKTGFVYVNGQTLCNQGGNPICGFSSTIKFVKRASGGTIGAFGFIVILDNNNIYFVEERNPSPAKVISLSGFPASGFSASNITDIVNSDRYVYVITSNKIYICEWTFNNNTDKYTLTKQSDVGGSSLGSGFWINNNLYVLRENNLSAFNTNTQAIQTKNIELTCKVNGANGIISQFQVLDGVNDSDRIYLANGSNLSVLSGDTLSVTHTVSAGTEIRSVKYNNDTDTVAVRDTQSLSIFNMPDLSVAYAINNLTGVTTDNFIDGKYVITDAVGLKVLEDEIINTSFVNKPSSLKDWQFYDLGIDYDPSGIGHLLRQFTYATRSYVKLHQIWDNETSLPGNSNTATLVAATTDALTHVKLVNSDYVYVSYVSSYTPTGATQPQTVSATFAYGVYGSQTTDDYGYVSEKLKIASKYFQDITPCQSDHCIFKDNVGIYIDDYTDYSGVKTDSDNNTYKKATQARLKQIYKFNSGEATNFQNVDIISKSDDAEIALINLKTKIVLVTFYRRETVPETVGGVPKTAYLLPSSIASIEAATTISLKYQSSPSSEPSTANASKVFFRLCSDDDFECTMLLETSTNVYNVYNVRFSKSDTQIILTDNHKVVDSVVGLISDTRYNQPCYIKQNGSKYTYYHLQSGQLIATFDNRNVEIKNMGNQNGFGFAYASGNNVVQIKKTNTSKQFNTYNTTQRNCKKIETYIGNYSGDSNPRDKNYVYFLNDNSLKGAEYLTIESFRNISPSQLSVENGTSIEQLSGVWDFTINNDNLYYVLTADTKKLHCRTRILSTDYVFGPEIEDILPQNIQSIALLKDDITQRLNLELPVALKTGTNQFIGVGQSIPTLTANGGFSNVSEFTESDSRKFYLFNHQDSQISSLSENLSTTNLVNNVTDIIPYGSGFGFLSSGTYFTWNENTETTTKVIQKTEGGDIYGFVTYQNCLYSMKNDGLYRPVFKKIYTLPSSRTFNVSNKNVQQISPIPNIANANLVVKTTYNKETYETYNGNTNNITPSKINGIKATDINRALIFYGDNNKRFVKKNDTEFYYSSDGKNFQYWDMTTGGYNNTLYHGYYFNNKFYIIDNGGLQSFDGYSDKTRAFKKIFQLETESSNANFGRFFELGENKYLLESDKGAFYVNGQQFIPLTDADKSVRGIKYVDFGNGKPQYYYSISNAVYATPSFKKITNNISAFVTISADNKTPAINDMIAQSPYDFLFATTSGLYQTTYQFTTSNNLTFYNESRVNQIYKKMVSSEISTILSNRIESHTNTWHTSNSIISAINGRILDVDFTRVPENWMTKTSYSNSIVVSNDIVSDITFGDQDNNIISVYTSNFIKTDRPNFNYIIKRYESGMTELYILLDTTNTYYISHVPDSGHTTTINQSFSRKNLEIFGENVANLELSSVNDIPKFTTSISVVLPQSTLSVNKLLDFEINGCSLPLKIYPDIDGDSFASPKEISGMYQSLIVPSQIKLQSDNLYQTSNGRTCFIGECFGTDQQSIKLHFYDSQYHS